MNVTSVSRETLVLRRECLRVATELSPEQFDVFLAAMRGADLLIEGMALSGKTRIMRAIQCCSQPASTCVTAIGMRGSAGLGCAAFIEALDVEALAGFHYHLCRQAKGHAVSRYFLRLQKRLVATQRLLVDDAAADQGFDIQRTLNIVEQVRRAGGADRPMQLVMATDALAVSRCTTTDGGRLHEQPFFVGRVRVVRLRETPWLDEGLCQLLRQARMGEAARLRPAAEGEGGVCVYDDCDEANAHNRRELAKLGGVAEVFRAVDEGVAKSATMEAPMVLCLNVGARVFALRDLGDVRRGDVGVVESIQSVEQPPDVFRRRIKLVFPSGVSLSAAEGGQRRVAVDFGAGNQVTLHEGDYRENRFEQRLMGDVVAVRRQLPIRLAWATSPVAAFGARFDRIQLMPGDWHRGKFYAALSLARTSAGVTGAHGYGYAIDAALHQLAA